MKIDKKLIVLALGLYKRQVVNESNSDNHDSMLELLIRLNEQIKAIKALWKK